MTTTFLSNSTTGTLTIGCPSNAITTSGTVAVGTSASGLLIYNTGTTGLGCIDPRIANSRRREKTILEENLSDTTPPSETTRLHRKMVRVTDLARPSIYILYREQRVIYVGQSVNAYQRMSQHLRDKEFTHIRIMTCRKDRMNYWEQKLIDALSPLLNVTHNKRRKRKKKLRLVS